MAAIPPCATGPACRCEDLGAPFDVLWLRLPVLPGDPVDLVGRVKGGQLFVMIYRADYWQCAYLIPKGGFDAIKAEGLEQIPRPAETGRGLRGGARRRRHHRFRPDQASDRDGGPAEAMGAAGAALHRRCRARHVAHRRRRHQSRHPGCGGDGQYSRARCCSTARQASPICKTVQARRQFPTRVIQAFQVAAQNLLLAPTLRATATPKPPLFVKLFDAWPWLRQFPARFIGMGVRPEHVTIEEDVIPARGILGPWIRGWMTSRVRACVS